MNTRQLSRMNNEQNAEYSERVGDVDKQLVHITIHSK